MEGGGGEGSGSPGSLEAQEPKTRPAHVNSIRKLEVRILYPLFAIQDYAGLGLCCCCSLLAATTACVAGMQAGKPGLTVQHGAAAAVPTHNGRHRAARLKIISAH